MKKREDHRIQERERLRIEAQKRKEEKEQRKMLERIGAKFCVFCKKNAATVIPTFGTEPTGCENCVSQNKISRVYEKHGIVPAVKTNLGSKLADALKK